VYQKFTPVDAQKQALTASIAITQSISAAASPASKDKLSGVVPVELKASQ